MSDAKSEVKRWTLGQLDRRSSNFWTNATFVSSADHDSIVAELKAEIEQQSNAYEFALDNHVHMQLTIARQAEVIEKLKLQRGTILHEKYAGFPLLAMNIELDLDKELETIEQGAFNVQDDLKNEITEKDATIARQAELIEKLKRYTRHRLDCISRAGVLQYSNDCDCGLKEIEQGEGT